MNHERTIDILLSINNKTRREKVKIIRDSIESYKEFLQGNSYNDGEYLFGTDFLNRANKLIAEIENDNSIAYERDWNWFYNADNIPNQEWVFKTNDFLEINRKDVFNPLYFFNLLFKQMDELKDSLDKPFDYVATLQNLPLSKIQRIILLGMILYWHGGFPVENLNRKYNTILKLIERAFINLSPENVELEFCQNRIVAKTQTKEVEEKKEKSDIPIATSGTIKAKTVNQQFDFAGKKIDMIRMLNALYELKLIKLKNGQIPTKENFMKEAGDFFGFDLTKYDVDLSQAYNDGNVDKNVSFFNQMKEITEKLVKGKI